MKVCFSCGGTGGHIYPALALAEKLQSCFFIGSNRLEKELIPRQNYTFYEITSHKKNPLIILIGLFQALKILIREKPTLIISTGGYVTIPVLLAGIVLGKKIYIQEQNLLPGKVNRILSLFAKKVFITYPDSKKYFPKKNTIVTGNPLRQEILNLKYNLEKVIKDKSVLVFGGSLAAQSINKTIYEIQKNSKLNFKIIHLDGKNYCHNMADAYKQSTVIVCRAGATSLAEIAAIGIPAILIPYPHAADNHQELNAKYFEDEKAAQMILDRDLSANTLLVKIQELINNQELLKKMSENMQKLGNKNAASLIINEL